MMEDSAFQSFQKRQVAMLNRLMVTLPQMEQQMIKALEEIQSRVITEMISAANCQSEIVTALNVTEDACVTGR